MKYLMKLECFTENKTYIKKYEIFERLSNLIKNAKYNNIKNVKKLIESGVDLNQKDDSGYTALIWAA